MKVRGDEQESGIRRMRRDESAQQDSPIEDSAFRDTDFLISRIALVRDPYAGWCGRAPQSWGVLSRLCDSIITVETLGIFYASSFSDNSRGCQF